jgi:hypothetical protein
MKHTVTATALTIRQGPGVTYAKIDYLKLNDVVDEISANADRSWLQIKRQDGLIGWVSSAYLKAVGAPPPPPTPPPSSANGVKRIIKAVVTYENESGAIVTQEVFPDAP